MAEADIKAAMDEDAFDALERDFNMVLEELGSDSALERFRQEYERLHGALRKSHDSEKRLMSKCRELNAELVSNAAKMQSVAAHEDEETVIERLRMEVKEAWAQVDVAKESEEKLKTDIVRLREEIDELTQSIEQAEQETPSTGEDIGVLIQQKKEIGVERDQLLAQSMQLRANISELERKHAETTAALKQTEAENADMAEQLRQKKIEIERETRRKEEFERDLKAHKTDLDAKSSEVESRQRALEDTNREVVGLSAIVQEKRMEIERMQAEQHASNLRIGKLVKQLEEQKLAQQTLSEDTASLKDELRLRQDETVRLKHEAARIQKMNDAICHKIKLSEDRRMEAENKRDELASDVSSLERELAVMRKQVETDRKLLDDLTRTRDVISKKMLQAGKETEVQEALVMMHEATKKHLEQELSRYRDDAQRMRQQMSQLEKERDRYSSEAAAHQARCVQALEEVKLAESHIFENKKLIADAELKLKQQQSLFEAVRNDRNLYSKNLIEAQDEINEMKRKLKIMNHQIDQLKEEVTAKEGALVRQHASHEEVEQQKVKLKGELDRLKADNAKQQKDILAQRAEQEKLQRALQDADRERMKQQKQADSAVNERDILSAQLIRRNDELNLVYEKLRIQDNTLAKGEAQYQQRLEDIRLLKREIRKLRREKTLIAKNMAAVDALKQEVFRTQRQLVRERMRCRAMEEELETPMNVHRWRKLEGSDPNTFDLVQKIQILQKRLIQKTEEVVEKDLAIQDKEKQYMELKTQLAKQPGPEIVQQLQLYQQTIKEKTKQLKAMASELNMYQAQVKEYQFDKDRLARELQDLKKRFFDSKRKEQSTKDTLKSMSTLPAMPLMSSSTTNRFTGGGFNLTPSTSMTARSENMP
eukprot:m.71478 g.71478  ORF g.71478 m.71478 type:complete len:880 (-) comp14366_c0_seq1:171-2810(-)